MVDAASPTGITLLPDAVTTLRQSTLAMGPPTPATRRALAVLDRIGSGTLSPEDANQVRAAIETLVGAGQSDRFLSCQRPASFPLIASGPGVTSPTPEILQPTGHNAVATRPTQQQAFCNAVQATAPASHVPKAPVKKIEPPEGDVVYMRMGSNTSAQADKLKAHVGDQLVVIQNSGDSMVTLEVNGEPKRFDLSTKGGVDAFIDALELEPKAAGVLRDLFVKAQGDAVEVLDELGQFAVLFAQAEKGERKLGSLVLSGHSHGTGVWTASNGHFTWVHLATLCKAFPDAAAQVKHVHIAACNNGRDRVVGNFLHMFPNMQTMWAYNGSAPSIAQGGAAQQQQWWNGLKSGQLKSSHPRTFLWQRTSNGGIVKYRDDRWRSVEEHRDIQPEAPTDEVWRGGLLRPELLRPESNTLNALPIAPMDIDVLAEILRSHRVTTLQAALDGHPDLEGLNAECWRLLETGGASTQQMRALYQQLLDIRDDQDVNPQSGQLAGDLALRMLRLIHFHEVREQFASAYGGDLAAANQVLQQMGLQRLGDPATVSRAQLRQRLAWLERVVDSSQPDVPPELREALRLLNGLQDMDPDVIPITWV